MHLTSLRPLRVLIAAGLIGFTMVGLQVHAQTAFSRVAPATSYPQATDVLVWQGRILPIVTDTFASINALGDAVQKNDAAATSNVGDEFAGELIRFQQIKTTPSSVKKTALQFEKGLKDLTDGTKVLAGGLRTASTATSRQGANQVIAGLNEFQQAVNQVRRNSGPIGEPTVTPPHPSGPVPTPIIRGLP